MLATLEPNFVFLKTATSEVRAYFHYGGPADAVFDSRGRVVRYAPWRRTVMHDLPDGSRVFCKLRHGRIGDAARELQALEELAKLGLNVPAPLFVARHGPDSVLGLASVPGRPVDALLAEGRAIGQVLREMPAVVRRMHAAGWVYRDLYWNHVFAEEGDRGLWLVDAERAFRPRFRFERWVVKDLAGLVSSWPSAVPVSRAAALRFLRDALGEREPVPRRLARRILAKADRIRDHVTKYPG